ncbi:MAG TPA: energy transducer TonB [Blastocatellia bacterium]|nr:energy transducer TonB [Blastocatellia bacterium]
MKPILAVLVLTIAASLDVGAQDVRSKVGPVSGTSLSNIIDPDKSIYGVQWGSSEDEFIARFGNPTGYIRLNASDTVMLYGKSHAFIFTASKLSGVRINMTVLDWRLSQSIPALTPFDGAGWQLSNGIRREMNLAEVKKILGESLKTERIQRYFNTEKARVEMDFAHYTMEGETDDSYKLHGIYIRQASSERAALQKALVSPGPPYVRVPAATQPCSEEVANWWQAVRFAAKEALDARRRKDQAVVDALRNGPRSRRRVDDSDSVLPQRELDKLDADIATAREKYGRLLTEGQVKSHRAPIEDSPIVILYMGMPDYSEQARKNKTQGQVSMRVEFRSDGAIGEVRVVSGLGDGLDEQSIKVIRQTIFLPRVKDGMFVTELKMLYTEFSLR